MKQTNTWDLPYPEINDFGNGALDLQILAEQAETQIASVYAGYASIYKKPTIFLTTTTNQSLPDRDGLTPFNTNNLLVGAATVNYQYGFDNGILDLHTLPSGTYLFGGSGQILVSGTLVANSYRQMAVASAVPNGAQFSNYKVQSFVTSATDNSLAAGVMMTSIGTFDYVPAPNPAIQPPQLWWSFQHGNTGTNAYMAIGATFFCTKISEIGP